MKKRQEVYDLYWYFACERQNIFIKKLNGESAPWTKDPILQEYKFCNSYRVNDRVNQYLLKNVIYNGKSYSDEDRLQNKIVKCQTMEEAFNIIKSYPLIGNFMAYQLVTDINYSNVVDWKEDEFTVAGPGSLRGIKKCFIDKGKMSNEDIIKYMYEHQDEEFKRLGLDFKKIGNRPLQLIDCQNIFCELDKYCRQALPNLKSNRTKIKKKYIPKQDKIQYFYPPKWNINNK